MARPGFYPSLEPWVRAGPADWPPIKRPGLRARQGVSPLRSGSRRQPRLP